MLIGARFRIAPCGIRKAEYRTPEAPLGRLSDLRSMVSFSRDIFSTLFYLFIFRRTSIAYGHPHMIDIQDCDSRLPSSGDATDLYMDELVRLSILLGRVQKAIYRFVIL